MFLKINAKILADKLGFIISNGKDIKDFIDISAPGIYRAGLELNGLEMTTQKNVIIWGTKEQRWFDLNKDNNVAHESVKKIIEQKPPVIFLSSGVKEEMTKIILKLATENQVPVIKSELHVTELVTILSYEISMAFASNVSVHGSLVSVDGIGVMIIGKSGVGKSEVVLELIQDGYSFVTDDTVKLTRVGSKFIGHPSTITQGFLEVRGIGLIDVPYIYGAKSIRHVSAVDLVIELVDASVSADDFDRLGNGNLYYKVLGGTIPKMQLPVKHGKSIKSLVIAAVSTFVAKRAGSNPLEEIQERIKKEQN